MSIKLKHILGAFSVAFVIGILLLIFNERRLMANFTYKQDVPSQNDPAKYDEAFAKWQAAGVKQYNLVVETSGPTCLDCGIFSLEVQDSHIISGPLPLDHFSNFTVEGLFAEAKRDVQSDGRCKFLYDQIAWQYIIEYDKQYGFPTRIERVDAQNFGASRECGNAYSIKVLSFHVLHSD